LLRVIILISFYIFLYLIFNAENSIRYKCSADLEAHLTMLFFCGLSYVFFFVLFWLCCCIVILIFFCLSFSTHRCTTVAFAYLSSVSLFIFFSFFLAFKLLI